MPPLTIIAIDAITQMNEDDPCPVSEVAGIGASASVGATVGVTGVSATMAGVGVGVTEEFDVLVRFA